MSAFLLPSVFAFAIGAVMGSFGNVVVLRGAKGESLGGRSRCPSCKKTLGMLDLIPIASFLFLRGKCRRCARHISWQYPLVEAGSGTLFLLAFLHEGFDPVRAGTLAFALWLLLVAALMDWKTGFIHDAVSIPLIAVGIAHAHAAGLMPWVPLAIIGGFFLAQWLLSRGRWVGSGDILLGAGIGAMLGRLDLAVLTLFVAYIAGALVALLLLFSKKSTLQSNVPFGPFLAFGGVVSALWGEAILRMALP